MESTRQTALDYADKARTSLEILPEHPLREMLLDLATYVVARVR